MKAHHNIKHQLQQQIRKSTYMPSQPVDHYHGAGSEQLFPEVFPVPPIV